jgi:tetratricopeptide (TPR) repeat protein
MANVYKDMGNIEEAKKMHKKSNEINPRYAYPYNNLGNIYVDERNYDEAIKCYKNAVKYKSNYVLAMANLGVCYLKVMNYRDAFHSISRAKELMEANIKDLSEGNKIFLRETL